MRQLPVDSSPLQGMTVEVAGRSLQLTIRYNSIGDHWAIDIYDEADMRWVAQGQALATGVPILWRVQVPYFFLLVDESGIGLDPSGGADLGSRCLLYIGEKSEIEP
ncbi:hypothetical protein LH425_06660 [Laribacter hongkongensis]|uniref:phage baseplate plug family protein n=1 Tax=Laribacter hongkongensis TaxID=168471 RepID=UPI00048922BE|nr:hypothetical protein [Laribacter hongkongensis]MCG9064725.1 hypothetical protein [Laribacter hongkongensis]